MNAPFEANEPSPDTVPKLKPEPLPRSRAPEGAVAPFKPVPPYEAPIKFPFHVPAVTVPVALTIKLDVGPTENNALGAVVPIPTYPAGLINILVCVVVSYPPVKNDMELVPPLATSPSGMKNKLLVAAKAELFCKADTANVGPYVTNAV